MGIETGRSGMETKRNDNLRVALVHDFLIKRGGAERVLEVLAAIYPDAPIYTLLYDRKEMEGVFDSKRVRTSYLQKFPKFLRKRHRWLLPFYPVLPETYDLREFDLIISSSGAWSKGIVTKLDTVHVAYLHSPMRFVWDYNERYVREVRGRNPGIVLRMLLTYLRMWDKMAAERPDCLIANSQYTRQRIGKYYRRDSHVIYPPVGLGRQTEDNKKDGTEPEILGAGRLVDSGPEVRNTKYFLVVSRLSAYKKVDVVVEAFNKLGLPLVVVGTGPEEERLRKIAKENVLFKGWQDDSDLADIYGGARAFIFPAEDDFGIAPVEAMAHGVPVVAYRQGGALETVIEGRTGIFFDAQTPEVLADGIRRFMLIEDGLDKAVIRRRGEEFSRERFIKEFHEYIVQVLSAS